MSEPRRLYRNTNDAILGGVCSGLADYLQMDKTVVRVLYVLISVFSALFPGILVYIVLLFVIPPRPPGTGPPPGGVPPG